MHGPAGAGGFVCVALDTVAGVNRAQVAKDT